MRDAPDLFGQIGPDSRSVRLLVDVFYDDNPTFIGLPVTDWDLEWDLESELKSTGSLTVAYTSQAGESLSPNDFLDVLAPYGQQVNVLAEATVGPFTAAIQLGRFRINQAPEASDSYLRFLDRTVTAGSLVRIEIDDLLSGVKRAGFHWPEPPIITDSTWGEIGRLTGLPVNPSLTDLPTPDGLIYQPKDGGRLEAVQQLCTWLGGIGVTNQYGEVTAVPYSYGDPVLTLDTGAGGYVIDASSGIDSDGLYNTVVGSYQRKDGTPIYGFTQTTTGPLSAQGPFGEYTYQDSSDLVTTQAAADARVISVLDQLQRNQAARITLTCIADYRLQPGDVATYRSLTGEVVGRAVSVKFTADGLMTVGLDVAR